MQNEINIKDIIITDDFWSKYIRLVKDEMIPYQWNVLNDEANIKIDAERDDENIPIEKSHAIENFKIAAGLKSGHHYGYVFQDSDVYKWLEAVSYSLINDSNSELENIADGVIDLIGLAQQKDGYLDTYFTIDDKERKFKRLIESHELYCAGHFMEAAAAYYSVTGKRKIIDIACNLANCIDNNFGPQEGRIHGYDGHEEVEIGLAKLYSVTKDKKYLELSKYFLYERGKDSNFLKDQLKDDDNKTFILLGMGKLPPKYFQVHKPILNQETAEGHSVRLMYMCTAMADIAYLTNDKEMLEACKKLWANITSKRMYITGGIGSTVIGEAFTFDYDLPNDTMYCETCASVGLIFFAFNMLKNEPLSLYGNVMERSLYNSTISGMALDGKHFFYVNPLEVDPVASKNNPGKSHVKVTRAEWFGCACCPPNLARTVTSLGKYIYTNLNNTIYTHLYMSNEVDILINNNKVSIKQETNYPWAGDIKFSLNIEKSSNFSMAFRIPDWCYSYSVKVNDEKAEYKIINGYISILRDWNTSDTIEIKLEMEIQEIVANPNIKDDLGKVAIQRGPFIYCLEEVDNGKDLHLIRLDKSASYEYEFDSKLLGGVGKIKTKAKKLIIDNSWEGQLYRSDRKSFIYEECEITFVPYYSWANRSVGEMRVFINKDL
ncbi:glycoside hydrolase family 127 protein [Clostridium estertheticum]|uniref:glycoside hydrolase family 127 protein n=1 Tax=Clostridium estertheticum TaxID=238834 RepID=UPI001C0AB4C1|nr:beta-L-arabinofuranosidase domain-containing protein [Clostridium estertheticum]MBU3175402.1 glycoside hydrolase family 127 protein [Clostridium estertheticum]